MSGMEYTAFALRLTTIMVPVAVYFLLLGLLNSRRHPQVLTGRRDFLLLSAALGPVAILPALHFVGVSVLTVGAAAALATAAVLLLAPRGNTWVIYNVSSASARSAVARALDAMGGGEEDAEGFCLAQGSARIYLSSFPLLRNVTLRLEGGEKQLAARFESCMVQSLARMQVETSPMAAGLLLVAMAMIVAPLAVVAPRAAEIVRILTDLLP